MSGGEVGIIGTWSYCRISVCLQEITQAMSVELWLGRRYMWKWLGLWEKNRNTRVKNKVTAPFIIPWYRTVAVEGEKPITLKSVIVVDWTEWAFQSQQEYHELLNWAVQYVWEEYGTYINRSSWILSSLLFPSFFLSFFLLFSTRLGWKTITRYTEVTPANTVFSLQCSLKDSWTLLWI